ncbi:unnamed protein product [Sphagnum tenellum]
MSIASSTDGSTLLLTGGYNVADSSPCSFTDSPYVYKSTNGGLAWTVVSDQTSNAPFPRSGHNSVVDSSGALLVIAGSTAGNETAVELNDVWKSVDGGVTFTNVVSSAGFPARDSASLLSFYTSNTTVASLYILGGNNGDQSVRFTDVWASSNNGLTWVQQTASVYNYILGFNSGIVESDTNSVLIFGVTYATHGEAILRFTSAASIGVVTSGVSTVVPTSANEFSTTTQSYNTGTTGPVSSNGNVVSPVTGSKSDVASSAARFSIVTAVVIVVAGLVLPLFMPSTPHS